MQVCLLNTVQKLCENNAAQRFGTNPRCLPKRHSFPTGDLVAHGNPIGASKQSKLLERLAPTN